MHLLAVTPVTDRRRMSKGENGSNLVPDMGVAIRAFNLMIGDMVFVDVLGSVFCRQDCRLIVALHTFSLRHVGVPLNNIGMALLAGHTSRDVLSMIEVPACNLDVSLRLDMTRSTTPDRARDALLLALWTSLIIVADKTVDLMNGEVCSLDQLGMAAGTAKLHPPSQLT